jgi:hypothetical protein
VYDVRLIAKKKTLEIRNTNSSVRRKIKLVPVIG